MRIKNETDRQQKIRLSTEGKREAVFFYILVAPFVNGLYLSLTNYTGYNYNRLHYVGFNNYARVFGDDHAMRALLTTLKIGLITVPLGLVVGLFSAMLLNKARKGLSVFRLIIYLPAIIPTVATGGKLFLTETKDC